MKNARLAPTWTHDAAIAKVRQAIAVAKARSGGEALHPMADDAALDDRPTLARARVRRDWIGYPIPGTSCIVPFVMLGRDRARDGAIGIVSGGFAIGLVADLLIFTPFGYRHRGVFVEVPSPGADDGGNGFYAAKPGWKVLYFDWDDRFLWRTDRMDEIAEAFEFLVREARSRGAEPGPR